MPVQNANNESDDRFDVGLSSVTVDGLQATHYQPGEEPWTASPQDDRNSVSADSFNSGVVMIKHVSHYQFTLNVTAFDPIYQKVLANVDEYCTQPHKIDAINQMESFHTNSAYLARESAISAGNSNTNRTLTFNTVHGEVAQAPK